MSRSAPSVAVLTHSPSPYQVELFDAIAGTGDVRLRVAYRYSGDRDRHWTRPEPNHEHVYLDGTVGAQNLRSWVLDCDFSVFNWYSDTTSHELLRERARSGQPWSVWGERPGARGLGAIGAWFRRFSLSALRRTNAPIWGIGQWAVEGWSAEFGAHRKYFNVPYASDLSRFMRPARTPSPRGSRRVLFSGSFIRRKGVDLLAKAFVRMTRDYPHMELSWLGTGKLERELLRLMKPLGHRVRFLGFSSWSDLPSHYAGNDVLCAPSRYDGWGLIVPEGLAAGMPVISTDRMGSARELIEPGSNGWRVASHDLAALEQALRAAADMDEEAFARMTAAASESVRPRTLGRGAEQFIAAARESIASFAGS